MSDDFWDDGAGEDYGDEGLADNDHDRPSEPATPRGNRGPVDRRGLRMAMAVAIPLLMLAAIFRVGRDDGASSGEAGEDPLVAYCATMVQRDAVRLPAVDSDASEEDGQPAAVIAGRMILLTESMLEVAPAAARSELESQIASYRELVRTQDPAGFRSAELVGSRERLNAVNVESCGLRELEFGATEFRYEGVPPSIAPGRINLQMRNDGNEAHEMHLYRRNPESSGDFSQALSRGVHEQEAELVVGGHAAPETSAVATADLITGRYVMICVMQTGREAHWQRGMIEEFEAE